VTADTGCEILKISSPNSIPTGTVSVMLAEL
jgi:hypothetical protein